MKYLNRDEAVKFAFRLLSKKGRERYGHYLVEGMHTVSESVVSGAVVVCILHSENRYVDLTSNISKGGIQVFSYPEKLLRPLSDAITPQLIFALIKRDEPVYSGMLTQPEARILILESLQDPGNTGTIIRTAEALGYDAVFYNKGTVDIYNTKVLRSMQGSHFHIPVIKSDVINLISLLKKNRFRIYGSSPGQGSVSYRSVSPEKKFAVIVGNEAKGIDPAVLAICDRNLFIDMRGNTESLNVSIAAAILMAHLYP